MLLEKVIVENIRSHKYYKLEPLKKGITAINGENGAGKSTLLDAVAWSLFGSRVNGQKNKDLIRDGVDPKDENVRVTTYISVGSQRYKIVRQIMNSNGIVNCKVYSKLDNNSEWKFESGPSVKYAEKEIRKILNSDEKGFLSSVFIQQKQVDQIISSTPQERGQVIEKLIGVSAITESINLGREEIRALQKASTLMKVESLEEAEERVVNQADKVKEIKGLIEILSKEVSIEEKELNVIEESFKSEKEKQDHKDNLISQLERLESTKKIYDEQLKNQLEIINNSKLKRGKKLSLEILEEEYNKINNDLNILREELFKLNKNQESLDIIFSEKLSPKETKKEYEEIVKLYEKSNEELQDVDFRIILLKEKVKTTKNLVDLLEKGSAKCSLCGNEFSNPQEELNKHKEELENYKIEAKQLTESKKLLSANHIELESKKDDITKKINILDKQNQEKDNYKKNKDSISKKELEIASLTEELDIINKKLITARAEKEKEEILSTAKSQSLETKNKISTLSKEIQALEKEIDKSTAISKKDFKTLEDNLLSQKKSYETKNKELSDKNFELILEKEKGKTILAEYNNCKIANEEYKRVVEQLNVLNMSNSTLQQFKKERIKTSIPALTKIASEIFSKFTEGKFTELVINEKFEAFVKTDKQNLRPVGLLSGGELSSAAIALRLAISLFLSNEQESLLILDEVLVSMSEDRSQTILETISSLSKSQIIFIAHNVSINQFADKVIQL